MLKTQPKTMFRKLLSILLIVVLILPAAGCWDSVDINERMIITLVIADKKDGEYVLYIETANMENAQSQGGQGSGGEKKYVSYKGAGKTLPEARLEIERQVEKQLYLGSVSALIITERLAKSGLYEYFARLNADFDYRKKIITITTPEEPEKILKISEHGESAGEYIIDQIENNDDLGYVITRSTARYFEQVSSRVVGFIIPEVALNEKTPEITGYCVIGNKTACIGSIGLEDAIGLNILKMLKDTPQFYYSIPYKDVFFTVKVERDKRKIKAHYKNGKISFDIHLKFSGEIEYASELCAISDEMVDAIRKSTEKTIKKSIDKALVLSQKEFKTDYLDFKDEFHMAYPDVYHDLDWVKEYPKAEMNVFINLDMEIKKGLDYETRYLE